MPLLTIVLPVRGGVAPRWMLPLQHGPATKGGRRSAAKAGAAAAAVHFISGGRGEAGKEGFERIAAHLLRPRPADPAGAPPAILHRLPPSAVKTRRNPLNLAALMAAAKTASDVPYLLTVRD